MNVEDRIMDEMRRQHRLRIVQRDRTVVWFLIGVLVGWMIL